MPFQRGNPKPLGSGRIKGIPNKRTLAAAAMAVGASDAYDPAYDDLKRMAVQFKEWIAEEKKRKPLRMGRLITLHDRLARILEKTCQYEKPKLQAITLAGDHNNPVQVRADLSKLVARLDRLARSTRDLLNVLAAVAEKKAGFRSL